jgi:hypothetical protein
MSSTNSNVQFVRVSDDSRLLIQQYDNQSRTLVGQPIRVQPAAFARFPTLGDYQRSQALSRDTPSTFPPSSPFTPGSGQLMPLSREATSVRELGDDSDNDQSEDGPPGQIVNPNNPYGGRFIPQQRTFSPTGRGPPTNWSDLPSSPIQGRAGQIVPHPGQVSQPSQSLHPSLTEERAQQYSAGLLNRYPNATPGQRWAYYTEFRRTGVMTDPYAVAIRARQRHSAQAAESDDDSE